MLSWKTGNDTLFHVVYQKAVVKINQRFSSLKSDFDCRVMFWGVLDVAHSILEWLQKIMNDVPRVLLSDLEVLTGATSHRRRP